MPVGHERVDPGQAIAGRTVAPVAVVRGAERLAVALGAARVGVPDADPGAGQALELPRRRPAVQRLRTTVDLEHERRRPAGGTTRPGGIGGRDVPALDAASLDRRPARLRLDEGDPGQRLAVELGQPAERERPADPARRDVEQVDVRELGRGRAQDGDPGRAGRAARDRVPARQVVVARGQALDVAVAEVDPPQLVGALDRRAEQERSAVAGRDEARLLADRQVAVHPGSGHQVVPGRQVPPATRAALGPVRPEQPDVRPAAGGRGVAVARARRASVRPAATSERRSSRGRR